jgi:hypothetical protein
MRTTALHHHRPRAAIAFSASVGIALLLATAPGESQLARSQRIATFMSTYAAQAGRIAQEALTATVSKCIVDGVTTYSDAGCADGASLGELTIRSEPREAPATPALQTESIAPDALRQARCDAAAAELRNIDALTAQGQPADMQAFLDARRSEKRHELFQHRC